MTIFRTGGVDIAPSAFLPGASTEVSFHPVWSALIRTTEGNVLFDTGLHPVHVERPDATFGPGNLKVVMAKEDSIVSRLSEIGIRPDDIAIVVNSHLHFDHAGNNGAFPKATFVVQGDHLAFAKGKPNFPGVYWDIPELSYLPVAGRARLAPGLEVVPTPGHAPGHQSLVVDLAETGPVVPCGRSRDAGRFAPPDAAVGQVRSCCESSSGHLSSPRPYRVGSSCPRCRSSMSQTATPSSSSRSSAVCSSSPASSRVLPRCCWPCSGSSRWRRSASRASSSRSRSWESRYSSTSPDQDRSHSTHDVARTARLPTSTRPQPRSTCSASRWASASRTTRSPRSSSTLTYRRHFWISCRF